MEVALVGIRPQFLQFIFFLNQRLHGTGELPAMRCISDKCPQLDGQCRLPAYRPLQTSYHAQLPSPSLRTLLACMAQQCCSLSQG